MGTAKGVIFPVFSIKSFAKSSVFASAICQNIVGSPYLSDEIISRRSFPFALVSSPSMSKILLKKTALTLRPLEPKASTVLYLLISG